MEQGTRANFRFVAKFLGVADPRQATTNLESSKSSEKIVAPDSVTGSTTCDNGEKPLSAKYDKVFIFASGT